MVREQDIQLHTHPAWRDDPRDFGQIRELKKRSSYYPQDKDFMFKCSLEEQVEILEHGIGCLISWCGVRPVAHRAGGYGLNQDTISALHRVGIPIDSSMHYLHSNSKLTWSINRVVARDGIVEVPVTGLRRHQVVTLGPKRWIRQIPFCKTDLNACSLDELLWFVSQAKSNDIRVMNLWMHSYSLLSFDNSFRWFRPDHNRIERLTQFLLATVDDPDVVYMSMTDFWLHYQKSPENFMGSDYLPTRYVETCALSLAATKIRQKALSFIRRLGWD